MAVETAIIKFRIEEEKLDVSYILASSFWINKNKVKI